MDEMELPKRGRPAWLAKELKISVTAAQRYFGGETLPRSTRWSELATIVHVNVQWLRDNVGARHGTTTHDDQFGQLEGIWRKLRPEGRADVLWYASQILLRLGEQPPAEPTKTKRVI